jgi:hypothetical protein
VHIPSETGFSLHNRTAAAHGARERHRPLRLQLDERQRLLAHAAVANMVARVSQVAGHAHDFGRLCRPPIQDGDRFRFAAEVARRHRRGWMDARLHACPGRLHATAPPPSHVPWVQRPAKPEAGPARTRPNKKVEGRAEQNRAEQSRAEQSRERDAVPVRTGQDGHPRPPPPPPAPPPPPPPRPGRPP